MVRSGGRGRARRQKARRCVAWQARNNGPTSQNRRSTGPLPKARPAENTGSRAASGGDRDRRPSSYAGGACCFRRPPFAGIRDRRGDKYLPPADDKRPCVTARPRRISLWNEEADNETAFLKLPTVYRSHPGGKYPRYRNKWEYHPLPLRTRNKKKGRKDLHENVNVWIRDERVEQKARVREKQK